MKKMEVKEKECNGNKTICMPKNWELELQEVKKSKEYDKATKKILIKTIKAEIKRTKNLDY